MWRRGGQYAYSQNSIRSPLLVKKLLNKSRISYSDRLIEIGAGKGIITQELVKRCKEVIAYEIDPALYNRLDHSLRHAKNLRLINGDFLNCKLPDYEYKIFSNLPFNFTSAILNKLLKSENPPELAYLIMQKEAAERYIGIPRETQLSLLLKPNFRIRVLDELENTDFKPRPGVMTVFIEIEKLSQPYLSRVEYREYRDFIVYATTRWKPTLYKSLKHILTKEQIKRLAQELGFNVTAMPLDATYDQWLGIFHYFNNYVDQNKKLVIKGSYLKQQTNQTKLRKVYRTRKIRTG